MRILAVDDDPLVLNLIEAMLELSGFDDVTTVESAVEAAQTIAQTSPPFECFLFDIRMNEIEGDDLCYWVRQLPNHATTPIIMVTALAGKQDIDRSFAAGATDYVTKPIDFTDLVSRLRQIEKTRKTRKPEPPKKLYLLGANRIGLSRVDYNAPMQIGDITGEIGIQSLENYICRVSQTGPHNIWAFAFALQDAAKLHFVCSREEFSEILQATGQSISNHMNAPGFFLSYVGYGAFAGLVQVPDRDPLDLIKLEHSIQQSVKNISVPLKNGAPIRAVPCASKLRSVSVRSGEKNISTLYRVVGEAVENSRPLVAVA